MTEDRVGLKGRIELVQFREGKKVLEREVDNLVVNAGKAAVAGLINSNVTTPFQYVAIGTVSTAPSGGDTSLGGEVMRGSAETIDRITTTVTNDTARWIKTFNFSTAYAITESGLFNSSSGGTLLARGTFAVINVASGDSLQITWKAQVS